MDYCKNKDLKNVGLHIEGVYPDKCELCREKIKKTNLIKKDKPIKITEIDKKKELEFRKETILANRWKEYERF